MLVFQPFCFWLLKTIDSGVFYTNYRELTVNYQTTAN